MLVLDNVLCVPHTVSGRVYVALGFYFLSIVGNIQSSRYAHGSAAGVFFVVLFDVVVI